MSRLSPAKDGSPLTIASQVVPFSYWPTVKQTRRAKLQQRIFTSDPWALIAEGIADSCPKRSREAALAFRAQAEDFYDAAISMGNRNLGAKPLLLYYSFLNLSKAYLLTRGHTAPEDRPGHGISERARIRQVEGARLTVHPSQSRKPQLFSQFQEALTGTAVPSTRYYRLGSLMPQILFGHRVWCSAANEPERFLPIKEVQYIDSRTDHEAWIRLHIDKQELAKLHLSQEDALKFSRLGRHWRFVHPSESDVSNPLYIEQVGGTAYSHRPSEALSELTSNVRPYLWCSVLLHPPYRKYYLYLSPKNETNSVLPQLLSMYLIMFLLGSITRYQPHQFDRLLETRYGAHLIGAVTEIPTQYLYLMASELLEREVTRASLA
ncbi:YaaC family protein [Granulicella mallensis]|uniref:YaaC-like Protein n=1 Tax=Granulicella mallensis TaxID=940614 RepID=A0A7W7ZNN1_9BACT|nr:YaaC family protein [Granulicella mallensis]MBB5063300.1 hypothetical protein [Granulicella mallensis]